MSIGSVTANPGGAIAAYLADTRNEQTLATKWASGNPQMQADIAYFKAQAPKLTSATALMNDYRSLKVVLSAFNVSNLLTSPALTKQLLTQDPSSSSSTVRKIGNPSYQIFANAFNRFTTNPFDAAGVASVVNSYAENNFEVAQNTTTPGMQNALAFTRTASQFTSITALMTSTAALPVVVAQTGITFVTYANMSYDQQVAFLTSKIKLSDFQNPAKVAKMAERYLIQAVQDPTDWSATSPTTNTVLSLLGGNSNTSMLSLFGGEDSSSTGGDPMLSLFA
ncbi:MAG: DUF1217 domain-containing protein [Mycobacterium sp.]|nr:DUF1217 domain-containing protein [Mycobacterium sp.]